MIPSRALDLLREWLPDDDEPERPTMQLATVDHDARPDVRTVLLSAWDERGFAFHTDGGSRKTVQLAAAPAVALALLWPDLPRQLVVRGAATPLPRSELDAGYARRSPYLRRLAWQNTEESAARPRHERAAAWRAFADAVDPAALEAPPSWAGYRVVPDRITFWHPDPDAPSHRVEYRRDGTAWSEHHLPG